MCQSNHAGIRGQHGAVSDDVEQGIFVNPNHRRGHMQFSNHAMARAQQRGIQQEVIDMVLSYGQPQRRKGNVLEYRLTKRNRAKIVGSLKRMIQLFRKTENKAVLVSGEADLIITTYTLT